MPGTSVTRKTYSTTIVAILICMTPLVICATEPHVITNSIGMKLVSIPAGEFLMGAEEDSENTLAKFAYCDPSWLNGELPRHKVRITKAFFLGQFEVTFGEFLKFYHDSKYKIEAERDHKPSWGYENGRLIESTHFRPWHRVGWRTDINHPVVYASWNDAVAFCKWLSEKEGQTYRLPTEAEWEYACRAGTSSRYYFGDEPEELISFANAADMDRKVLWPNATIASFGQHGMKTDTPIPFPFLSQRDRHAWTAPVGRFRPNDFGLYDMHGNAWEWCSDCNVEDYYHNSPADDPQGPATGSSRVLRGGGFTSTPVNLRCAARFGGPPSYRFCGSSFRVVRVQ
ncbi:MAG: formylglycine-rating enzyme family protein [Planctomycetaceae bacterium]|nr:formylglycine-rating enzyme family protein [Planctomycetaceae bacterium]